MDGPILTQVHALKTELYPKLKTAILYWQKVDLGFHATVEVCVPVSVTMDYAAVATKHNLLFTATTGTSPPLYLPVKKLETWEMAQYYNTAPDNDDMFPLTRKVLDSTYKDPNVTIVPKGGTFVAGEETDNFVKYSEYLSSKGAKPDKLFSGAIKLWILSNVKSVKTPLCPGPDNPKEDPSVNYGMYDPGHAGGRWQGAASCHNQEHHDYSQILQLMRNFKLYGRDFDMGTALLTAHPAVWDEPNPYAPSSSDLKYLPFAQPLGTNPKSTTDFLAGQWMVQYAGSNEETYTFQGKTVKWKDKFGGLGDGYWIEKARQIQISWRNTGSTEVWPVGATSPLDVTLNFFMKGKATKI